MAREYLNKLILFGEEHLRRALKEFTADDHKQRSPQDTADKHITPNERV